MRDLTPYQISCYVDGELSSDEASALETALATDPAAAELCAELKNLGDLFAPSAAAEAAEELPEELLASLYKLGNTESLSGFKAVKLQGGGASTGWNWRRIAFGAVAAGLMAIGLMQLLYRPEVVVTDLIRQVVDERGNVLKTERLASVTMRAGDLLRARAGERVSCRLPDGALVVLLSGGSLRIGDPRDDELFELDEGMALCTVADRAEPRVVHAAGCEIRTDSAHFGVRVAPAGSRSMGPALAASTDSDVAVAVSRGSLQVSRDGASETVRAGSRVILRQGAPVEKSQVWQDPLFVHLMRNLKPLGHEILPGFFSSESGVHSIPVDAWGREPDGARILALTNSRAAFAAHYLILYVRCSEETALAVTRIVPDPERPGTARTITVRTAPVGRDWTVVAIARKAFEAPGLAAKERKIPVGRSRLVRLEIKPAQEANQETKFELRSSLWAPRPPADIKKLQR